jgi:putative hydrolase of the HAD superfamily
MNTDRRGRVIEAVLFDADGVVQTTAEGWRDALGGLCGDPSRTETFLQAVFDAERPALTGHSNFESSLVAVLESWGCAAGVEEALRVWEMIEPSEAVLSIVDRLRTSGTRVVLATNQQSVRARFMTEELGYHARFDDLFYSCHLGAAKPEPEYFERVLALLELDGTRVLFVDDHPRNVEAARQVGLHSEIYDLGAGSDGMLALLGDYGLVMGGG